MKNKLFKITFRDLAFGSLVLSMKYLSKKRKLFPAKRIGEFVFINALTKNNNMTTMTQGVYTRRGKKYFIKTWVGGVHDLNYFMLLKEFNNAAILWKYYSETKILKRKEVAIPKVYGYLKDKYSLSVVFEFIDGESLEWFSTTDQVIYLTKVSDFIKEIGEQIKSDAQFVTQRTVIHYLALLPIITLSLVVESPKDTLNIVKSALYSIFLGIGQMGRTLELSHGDFTPDNFVVKNNKIYLTDLENAAFTLPGYDLSTLAAIDKYSNLFMRLNYLNGGNINKFIYRYICLHLSLGSGNFMQLDREYLKRALI